MIDHDAAYQALRDYMLPTVVATTGDIVLTATATGFTRADGGSFVSDRFAIGMEVTSTGFLAADANITGVVTSVAPTELRVTPFIITIANGVQSVTRPAIAPDPAGGPRQIIAYGVPTMRSWENLAPLGLSAFIPVAGIPYISDEYTPSTSVRVTAGWMEDRGDYIVRLHGVIGAGSSGARRMIDALKNRFAPNTKLVASDHGVRISNDPAPDISALVNTTSGPILTLTVPWIVRSRTTVPA
jgi:hypothetical protein